MDEVFQNNMKSSGLEDYMVQKRIEIMISMANKKVTGELDRINTVIGKLSEEIIEIKKKLTGGIHLPIKSVETFDNKKPQESFKTANNQGENPKPRYGDYKPEDVKIDDFFYFGNKK